VSIFAVIDESKLDAKDSQLGNESQSHFLRISIESDKHQSFDCKVTEALNLIALYASFVQTQVLAPK